MRNIQFHLAICLLMVCNLSLAGGEREITGQAGEFKVDFADPRDVQNPTIDVSKLDNDFSYSEKVLSIQFLKECSVKSNKLQCKKNGITPLAGATYQITNDGSPYCPGAASEARFTCIAGCKASVPKYLKINPYEC